VLRGGATPQKACVCEIRGFAESAENKGGGSDGDPPPVATAWQVAQ
jgi:hypothetical protein